VQTVETTRQQSPIMKYNNKNSSKGNEEIFRQEIEVYPESSHEEDEQEDISSKKLANLLR
jgi:hypothetical protein